MKTMTSQQQLAGQILQTRVSMEDQGSIEWGGSPARSVRVRVSGLPDQQLFVAYKEGVVVIGTASGADEEGLAEAMAFLRDFSITSQ
jgi:hypothetical protein